MTTGQIVRVLTDVDKRLERLESWGGGGGAITLLLEDNLETTAGLGTYNNARRASFDAGSLEYIRWALTTRVSAPITVTLVWSTTSTNTGKVAWNVVYRIAGPGGAVPGSDTTLPTQVSTGNHTQYALQTTKFVIPAVAGATGNGVLVVQVQRDATHASDTYNADAYLYGVNLG